MNEPFRDDASPRDAVSPKVLHNANFLPSSRCTVPPLCLSWNTLFRFPNSIFCFSLFHFHSRCELQCIHWWLFIWSWWAFISASAKCALVKEKSFFHKYAYRYRDESTLMNAFSPSLPYIFLFIPVSEVLECCDFSHLRVIRRLCTKGGERGGEGRREERGRGGEQDTPVKGWSRRRGGTPGSFLNRGNKEACGWRQEEDDDEQVEIISGSQLYWLKISQILRKRHTPKAVFFYLNKK